MHRPRREFSVFSLAAIDLFCSAMGAFMIISIILTPYFRNQQNQAPQQEISKLKEQLSRSSALALFGIVTHAKSVAVVVDLSGSIDALDNIQPRDPKNKDFRPQVRKVCGTIIEGMTAAQMLQMIGFHSPKGQIDIPFWQNAPAPMDAAGQNGAKAFVEQLLKNVAGGTPTRQALRQALGQNVEAIFLITDGIPNEGEREGPDLCDEIVKDITAQNGGRKEIHCIGVGMYNSEPYCVEFLERLSKQNRGQFLGMPDL
jgi:von Willebrand factor type A domain